MGWFSIYDIYKGIRGELEIELKLKIIGNENIAKNRFS
jgi:hypothetical protein